MMSLKLKQIVVCMLATLCITGALLEALGQEAPESQPATNSPIVELLQKRFAVLSQLVKMQTEEYHQGKASVDAMIHAHEELIKVKLELAATDDDRNTLLEQAVRLARDLERTARAKYKVAQTSQADVLKAHSERLKKELDLLREPQRSDEK